MFSANFRLISPLRVDCLLQPGVEFCEKQANHAFWSDIAREIGAEHMRHSPEHAGLQYESTSSVDLPNDIAVLRKRIDVAPASVNAPSTDSIDVVDVVWHFCDFGILLVETTLAVVVGDRSAAEIEKDVQAVAAAVNDDLVAGSYGELRKAIKKRKDHEDFVVFEGDKPVENAWASRALIFDRDSEDAVKQQEFAVEWLNGNKVRRGAVDKLARGEAHHHAEWMNYVYAAQTPENAADLREDWKALLRAQFFYSAMGRIDSKLTEILSWAMSRSSEVSTSKLREQLRQEMDFAEALLLKKSEVGKYVNPSSRQETERILEVWDFDDVLADPVQMKLQICQSRIDNIESERARSASFFTDLILMVIGVTSILGTTLAVVTLGREASVDPNQTVYDLGAGDLTAWIATQPVDVILLISTIISGLMVAAFIVARKRSES